MYSGALTQTMSRRRIPTVLKIAAGNPGRRPLNKFEPKPATPDGTPPESLNTAGLERWYRLYPMLSEMGVMTVAELDMLVRYCNMAVQFDECQAIIQKQFDFKVANHQLKLADKLLNIEKQFGMTPASRSGIIAKKPKQETDATEQALFG
jgi:P27 family predicted phage terminase small subunit